MSFTDPCSRVHHQPETQAGNFIQPGIHKNLSSYSHSIYLIGGTLAK